MMNYLHRHTISIIFCLLCIEVYGNASTDSIRGITLDDVLVEANHIHRQGDHLVCIPTIDQKNHAQTGYDLLYNLMIPGLTINKNGMVSTLGMPTSLYINGQPTEMQDVLYLQPKDVTVVEIYDATQGKYANDNVAINFIVKQYDYGGYLQASADQSIGINNGDYRIATSLSKDATTYFLFGGYKYHIINNVNSKSTEQYCLPSHNILRETTSFQQAKTRSEYLQLQSRYQKPNKSFISKLSFIGSHTPTTPTQGTIITNNAAETAYSTVSSSKSLSPKLDINGEFAICDNKRIIWGIHGRYAHNDYERFYIEESNKYHTNATEDVGSFNGGIIFTQQLSKGTFTVEMFDYFDLFKTKYSGNYDNTNRLWKNEALAFISYVYPISTNVSLQTRLGIDWYQYRLTDCAKFSTWNPRANIKLTNRIAHGMLLWSFMLANSNVGMDVVNNASVQINPFLIRQGNPNLHKSYDIDTYFYYSLPIRKLTLTTMVQYQYFHNPVAYTYTRNGNYIIQSFGNTGNSNIVNMILGASYRPSNHLAITCDVRYNHTKIDYQTKHSHSNISNNIGFQWYYKNVALMSSINFATSMTNRYSLMTIHTPFNYNFKISYSIRNISASATAFAPFKKRHIETSLDTPYYSFDNSILNRQAYQHYTFSLTYFFEFGRKVKRVDLDIDKSIKSAILHDS